MIWSSQLKSYRKSNIMTRNAMFNTNFFLKLSSASTFIFIDSIFRFFDSIKHKFNGNQRESEEHNTIARKMHPQITKKFICFCYVQFLTVKLSFHYICCWQSQHPNGHTNPEKHKRVKLKSKSALWIWQNIFPLPP